MRMKTLAYLRVSTDKQDLDSQRLEILDHARKERIRIDDFMLVESSSGRSDKHRRIDELLGRMNPGDGLIVSELSRLGRSLGQIIRLVDELIKREVSFTSVKENIRIHGEQDIQTKVMVAMFGLFAEIERDLISQRTKQGLAAAREKGKLLGRPKGSLGKSKLDGKEEEIQNFLAKGVSMASLARIMDVSRSTLYSFIRNRRLERKVKSGSSGISSVRRSPT
jgi:DNA invertase Pin-like site-specific DNA recombinase